MVKLSFLSCSEALDANRLTLVKRRQLNEKERLSFHASMLQVILPAGTNADGIYSSEVMTQAVRHLQKDRLLW